MMSLKPTRSRLRNPDSPCSSWKWLQLPPSAWGRRWGSWAAWTGRPDCRVGSGWMWRVRGRRREKMSCPSASSRRQVCSGPAGDAEWSSNWSHHSRLSRRRQFWKAMMKQGEILANCRVQFLEAFEVNYKSEPCRILLRLKEVLVVFCVNSDCFITSTVKNFKKW